MRTVVVFPAPLGPSSASTVPAATSRSTPSSTVVDPYAFRSPDTATIGDEILRRSYAEA